MNEPSRSPGQAFRAMQPWRTMLLVVPWWNGVLGIVGVVLLATVFWPEALDEGGPVVAFLGVFTVLWLAVPVVTIGYLRRVVPTIDADEQGVVLHPIMGEEIELAPDDVASLGRTAFVPQPGWLRVRDSRERSWILPPVEDEFALTDLLRSMVDDQG